MAKDAGGNIAGLAALGVGGFLLWQYFKGKEGPCIPGTTECRGKDLYTCTTEGKWELTEADSPGCQNGEVTPGHTIDKNTIRLV